MSTKRHSGGVGTFGGFNEGEVPSDVAELRELDQHRAPDPVDDTLREMVTTDIGPHIINKSFRIEVPLTRGMDITFDRYYPKLKLLFHSFARRRLYTNVIDLQFDAELEQHRSYAEANGFRFLACVDGSIEIEDLRRLRSEIAA